MTAVKPTVLLVDDHEVVRQGLRLLLEHEGFEVVGEASNGREAITLAEKVKPQIAVIDITMPQLNGLDAGVQIRRVSRGTKIVVLTVHIEEEFVREALSTGISGYVVKAQGAHDLVRALREVMRDAIYLSPSISRSVVEASTSRRVQNDALTPREREVLQLVAEGYTTKEIANLLNLSFKTAESHRGHIMQKLHIHETAGLVRYAIRHGVIEP